MNVPIYFCESIATKNRRAKNGWRKMNVRAKDERTYSPPSPDRHPSPVTRLHLQK